MSVYRTDFRVAPTVFAPDACGGGRTPFLMVHRCVCFDVSFSQIAALAAKGWSFDQISVQTGCCRGCGMCEPYVRLVISTGLTNVPLLSPQQAKKIMEEAGARGVGATPGQASK